MAVAQVTLADEETVAHPKSLFPVEEMVAVVALPAATAHRSAYHPALGATSSSGLGRQPTLILIPVDCLPNPVHHERAFHITQLSTWEHEPASRRGISVV